MFKNKISFSIIFYTGLLLTVTGGLIQYCYTYSDYSVELIHYKTPSGYNVEALLYIPSGEGPFPVVIPFCGVVSTKEMFHTFSIEMCRSGYAVFIPDLHKPPGKWLDNIDFFEYVTSGIDYLKDRKEIKSSEIAFMGHSWGGYVAHNYGVRLSEVKTVVSFGMSIYSAPDLPPDILLASGIYDVLHPPGEMLSALRESSGEAKQQIGELKGDLVAGTGRKQIISLLTDHSSEILDPVLLEGTSEWLNMVFGREREKVSVKEHYRIGGANIRNFGLFLLFYYLSFYILSVFFESKKLKKQFFLFPFLCFILLIFARSLAGIFPDWAPPAGLIVITVMFWTGFLYRQYFSCEIKDKNYIEIKYLYTLRFVAVYFLLIWFSFILSLIILRLPFLISYGWILKASLVIPYKFFTDGYFYFAKLEPFFGLSWSQPWLRFFIVLLPLTLLEAFCPGLLVGIFVYITGLIFKKRKKIEVKKKKKNKKEIITVLILSILAVIAWLNLLNRGVCVNKELLLGLAGLFFKFFILPIVIFIILYKVFSRFSWFPRFNR